MSDNISLAKQRACTDLRCEDEKYIIDVFSYVQPGHHGGTNKTGMIKVYSDRFCWSNAQAGMLIAQLEMGDFQAVKQVERRKIDQMKLPEKITYTLPPSNATSMKMTTRLLNESQEHFWKQNSYMLNYLCFPRGDQGRASNTNTAPTR
ncbi:hypothetical protein OS493_035429 [Desmophyllum pertusum]|uniref:Uncharacterized protein n=1 Tax=Desmophyllum pertusum TaxID=174260 RepID=A0A9W9ZK24_9CNID|nr:hypothetical protein OS493_035429 [Desmophyllum pertusum]